MDTTPQALAFPITIMDYHDNQTVSIYSRDIFGWRYTDDQFLGTFEFEKVDRVFWHYFVESTWKLPLYCGTAYLLGIFALREYMKQRPAFDLKWVLFVWNFCLGVFSIIGFVRTAPGLAQRIYQNGLYDSICVKDEMPLSGVFWGLVFALSKFVELGDTLFLLLKKRPLIFLQWYHHLITMWVSWTVAHLVEPILRWYVVLNYGAHALLYPYFALRTLGFQVPTIIAHLITTLQLAQMIVGFTVNIVSLYLTQTGYPCVRYPMSIKAFMVVYGSFVILFGRLFYKSIINPTPRRKASKFRQKAQ